MLCKFLMRGISEPRDDCNFTTRIINSKNRPNRTNRGAYITPTLEPQHFNTF